MLVNHGLNRVGWAPFHTVYWIGQPLVFTAHDPSDTGPVLLAQEGGVFRRVWGGVFSGMR